MNKICHIGMLNEINLCFQHIQSRKNKFEILPPSREKPQ